MLTFVYKVNRMFLEKNKIRKGSIEVICGSMFSGKTEELIRRLGRAKIAKQSVIICKPSIEDRYDKDKIVSHNMRAIDCVAVGDATDIIELCIAPSCRRQGLAASLLDNMKQQAISRNITQITLEVRQTNLAACALYEKAGFQAMHRRTGYYQTRDGAVDALLMACRLGC